MEDYLLNLKTLSEITTLPVMMILRYPKDTYAFKANYKIPTILDGVSLTLASSRRHYGEEATFGFSSIFEEESFKYASQIPLVHKDGSTDLYLLPLMVFMSELPSYAKRNNVQNYSNVEKAFKGSYDTSEINLTLRSVGITPKKLFGHYIDLFKEHGVKFPGKDCANYLSQMLEVKTISNDDFIKVITGKGRIFDSRDYIQFELPGPENNQLMTIPDICYGKTSYHAILSHLYYKTYKSWFDDTAIYLTSKGSRVFIAHHSVFAKMRRLRIPKDLTLHPSKFLEDIIKEMAEELINDKDYKTYPEEFKTILDLKDSGIRQIMSTAELKGEGEYMRHCVGGESYLDRLVSGTMIFFHLNIEGISKGATLSLKRSAVKHYDNLYRLKGLAEHEWWSIDQYYGYRDDPMRNYGFAMELQKQFLDKYFEKMTPDCYKAISEDQELLWKLNCEANRTESKHRSLVRDAFGFPYGFNDVAFGGDGREFNIGVNGIPDRRACGMLIGDPNDHLHTEMVEGLNGVVDALGELGEMANAMTQAAEITAIATRDFRRDRTDPVAVMTDLAASHYRSAVGLACGTLSVPRQMIDNIINREETEFQERVEKLRVQAQGVLPKQISLNALQMRFSP